MAVDAAVVADAAAGKDMRRPRRLPIGIWYRLPLALRVLILVAAWFTYGALLSNLNVLDDGSRTAEIIWGACAVGLAVSAVAEVWRSRLSRSRLAAILTPMLAAPYLGFGALSAHSSRSQHRVLLLWMLALGAIWLFVVTHKRLARIRHVQSVTPKPLTSPFPAPPASGFQKQLRSNAETPMAGRIVTTSVMTTATVFLVLLVADLDSVVHSEARDVHLTWAAVFAIVLGVTLTVTAFEDPRLRATQQTIDEILQYDLAFRAAELPAQFDVDQWQGWIKEHRRSDAVTLIWAAFFAIVAGWSVLTHPPGYHWIVATLLIVLAAWQIHRWQDLRAMNARLKMMVERHAIRQLYG
ncbi:hypothetical protein [Mycobacterium sp. BK086]|uniref:hypothetical protein n=1 Tax=Mycobacterium sp. BK086 TaxID=2512165 RepID=UPI00105B519F|nr:hypothetical protein [Mycobacterium sp. BK086]